MPAGGAVGIDPGLLFGLGVAVAIGGAHTELVRPAGASHFVHHWTQVSSLSTGPSVASIHVAVVDLHLDLAMPRRAPRRRRR